MMMQMLQAGGVPLLVDDLRPPDADNPMGYFEYAPVKRIAHDSTWIRQARGKAVKIVATLLPHLPAGASYKVIFMRRKLDEVLASQAAMLDNRGQPPGPDAPRMAEIFAQHLAGIDTWLGGQPHIDTLNVSYARAVDAPLETSTQVCAFLGGTVDREAMAAAVAPDLYRQR